jgi:hypothetical protein
MKNGLLLFLLLNSFPSHGQVWQRKSIHISITTCDPFLNFREFLNSNHIVLEVDSSDLHYTEIFMVAHRKKRCLNRLKASGYSYIEKNDVELIFQYVNFASDVNIELFLTNPNIPFSNHYHTIVFNYGLLSGKGFPTKDDVIIQPRKQKC